MSSIYQLFNQNFVSSELYYLPINTGINKILTCKDLLGQFEWTSLGNIAVTDLKSDNSNILVNNTFNTFQQGEITLSLNNNLNNLNSVNCVTLNSNNLYGDIKTNIQSYITVMSNLITAGNLDKINTNNIQPTNPNVSLGTSINKFNSLFLSSTSFSLTVN